MGRFRHSKVRPSGEVEVSDGPYCVSPHHPELIDVPVGVVGLVEDGDLYVSVVDRVGVGRPVLVTLLSPLLVAPGQHHDGPGVRLPAHPPEVVSGRVERTLSHYELPLGVEPGHEAGVDVVASLLVISRLELDPAVVVGEDVGEPVLGSVHRQVRGSAQLVPANVLQLLVLLAEPEVAVGRHDPVVLGEVLQFDRSGGLNDGVR